MVAPMLERDELVEMTAGFGVAEEQVVSDHLLGRRSIIGWRRCYTSGSEASPRQVDEPGARYCWW